VHLVGFYYKNCLSCSFLSFMIEVSRNCHPEGCTNPGHQGAVATKLGTVASNILGSTVWNWLHVNFLAPRILRLLLDVRKIYAPLVIPDFSYSNVIR
jgi:hypothetical protein